MVFAIYIYFFVFSKIDKNTVFTVSVHDQNTVSLPKLLNEAKIGKISHCVMRWNSKQNTNMKLWKMCILAAHTVCTEEVLIGQCFALALWFSLRAEAKAKHCRM